ncbi:MAG: hypothetical protein HZY73_11815 [Micropruina sp.]|nr:MAG: hypothetical protein HZY73_11815 [Micropruina sp.]
MRRRAAAGRSRRLVLPGTEPAAGAELVLVDQVEDLLRLAPDARRAALDAVVVLSLRADAWADALAVPELEGPCPGPSCSRPISLIATGG